MTPIDIHTHTPRLGAVYNLSLDELRQEPPYSCPGQALSAGLHPWDLTEDWTRDFRCVEQWARLPQVKAVGETGFDNLRRTPCQEEAFRAHVRLSEELQKPLMIHCVKNLDALLRIQREMKPVQTWIFHGFRGNPQTARILLDKGISLSFGEHFNPATVACCPADRLYMETDDSTLDFQEIVRRISRCRSEF